MRTENPSPTTHSPAASPRNEARAQSQEASLRDRSPPPGMPGARSIQRPKMRPEASQELNCYLTTLHALGQPPDRETLERLANANQTVDRVRKQLSNGPGNTTDMNAATQADAPNSTMLARLIADDLMACENPTLASTVVGALEAKGGNCHEFASVAAYEHANRMADGCQVGVHVKHCHPNHVRAQESAQQAGSDIPKIDIDAWKRGPALLLEHSSNNAAEFEFEEAITHEGVKKLNKEVSVAKHMVEQDQQVVRRGKSKLERENKPLEQAFVRERPSTLSQAFLETASEQLNVQIRPDTDREQRKELIARGFANLKAARQSLASFDDTAANSVTSAARLVIATRAWVNAQKADVSEP